MNWKDWFANYPGNTWAVGYDDGFNARAPATNPMTRQAKELYDLGYNEGQSWRLALSLWEYKHSLEGNGYMGPA